MTANFVPGLYYPFTTRLQSLFLTAGDLGANIAQALKVSTCKQTWRLDTIAQHEKI